MVQVCHATNADTDGSHQGFKEAQVGLPMSSVTAPELDRIMSQSIKKEEDSKYTKYLPFLDHNYNLVMLLGLTLAAIGKALQQQARTSGLTASEYELLILVKELGDRAIPAELSRILLRRPPSITTLLNRMEKRGLVKRKAHPDNKKKKIVAMTQKGQQALEVAGQRDALDDIIRTMSSEKYARLWDLLEELKGRAAAVSEAFE